MICYENVILKCLISLSNCVVTKKIRAYLKSKLYN